MQVPLSGTTSLPTVTPVSVLLHVKLAAADAAGQVRGHRVAFHDGPVYERVEDLDAMLAVGLRPQRLRPARRAQATDEYPGTGSHHLVVECVDVTVHRFVLDGRIEVIGVVNGDEIPRHDISFRVVGGRAGFTMATNERAGFRQVAREFSRSLPSRLVSHRHRPGAELQPAHELKVDELR